MSIRNPKVVMVRVARKCNKCGGAIPKKTWAVYWGKTVNIKAELAYSHINCN